MGPHAGQPVLQAGRALGEAPVVMVMVHGRNAGPENILDLVPRLNRPDVTYLAPDAANRTWYPYSFMADIASNEPWLSSALSVLEELVSRVEASGVARGQIQLLASLFSPDGPNDIAPPGFNALDPEPGMPASPLDPRPAPTGFQRD